MAMKKITPKVKKTTTKLIPKKTAMNPKNDKMTVPGKTWKK